MMKNVGNQPLQKNKTCAENNSWSMEKGLHKSTQGSFLIISKPNDPKHKSASSVYWHSQLSGFTRKFESLIKMVMDSLITHIPKNREPLREIKRVSDVVPLANTKVLHKNTAKSVMTVIPLKLKIPTVGSETIKTKQQAKNIETPLIRMEHVISE
jgi:hypothetical protein